MDNTEASASIAGYGYQFERALYRIFHSSHRSALFGIETADDVEEIIPTATGTKSRQEQDKLTLSDKNPLQDSSRNVWNTLRNWLNKLKNSRAIHEEIQFILVTNAPVPEHSLIHSLASASSPEQVSKAITRLKTQARAISGTVGEIAAEVSAFDNESLSYVIENLELITDLDPATLKESMYAALQLPSGLDEHKDLILDSLTGYLFNSCLDNWRRKEPFWTNSEPLFNRKQILFDRFLNEAWTARKQDETEYKSLMELNRNLNLPFISQLKEIGILKSTIEKELGHYWAGYAERSRLLMKGKILPEHFDELEDNLQGRWDNLREAYSNDNNIPLGEFSNQDHKKIYILTTTPADFRLAVGRFKSNHRYLYLGTYHHQANNDGTKYPVHWHQPKDESL